jgi:hypothetical protein
VGQLYFFLMQRAALELGRRGNVSPEVGRLMLPEWYVLATIPRVASWIVYALAFWQLGWQTALALWGISFLASTLCPIPKRHFIPVFFKKVSRDIAFEANDEATGLMLIILREG